VDVELHRGCEIALIECVLFHITFVVVRNLPRTAVAWCDLLDPKQEPFFGTAGFLELELQAMCSEKNSIEFNGRGDRI
jgi:hypothetical protein